MGFFAITPPTITGTASNPAVIAPVTESLSGLTKVGTSDTSVLLLAANADRKSLIIYNDSDKACFVSADGNPATTNTATTPNFKYWIPAQYAYVEDGAIPVSALNVISESGAVGNIFISEGV